jgi:tRNA nucleotidyltransferase/poly(A) polymerase
MADYIYTMETRLSPDQLRAVHVVEEVARAHDMNLYVTGGTVRDFLTGFPIRDLDFTVEGNPQKLQKDLEKQGVRIESWDDDYRVLRILFSGNVRGEIDLAHTERFEKTGKPPVIAAAGISEDLRRRDFTVNAMALSLNSGSRGLLLDPTNGAADIELKVIRVLHNYSFLEDPSRLIRATRFAQRWHWEFEERTKARHDSAKENSYIDHMQDRVRGIEIAKIAMEDDPLNVMKALEREGWLEKLEPHWTTAKVDQAGLQNLMRVKQQLWEIGSDSDAGPAVMHFLTYKLIDKELADMQKRIPIRSMVESWKGLEEDAKSLAKRLTGKEAATPSLTWKLLSAAKPEDLLFLAATGKQQAVNEKIKNFFGKWRQNMQKFPLPEMTELQITAAMPNYKQIVDEAFLLMLDGKLHTHSEIMKHFKPLAPPPPPPPPPPKRGRAAKAAEAAAAAAAATPAGKAGAAGKKGAAAVPAAQAETAKPAMAGKKTAAPAKETPGKKGAPVKEVPAKQAAPKVAAKAAPAKVKKKAVAKAPAKPAKPAPKAAKPKPAAKKANAKAAKNTGKKK